MIKKTLKTALASSMLLMPSTTLFAQENNIHVSMQQIVHEINDLILNKSITTEQKINSLRNILVSYNVDASKFSESKINNLFIQLKQIVLSPQYNKRMGTSAYCKWLALSEAVGNAFAGGGGTTGTAQFQWCLAHGYLKI